MTDPESEMCTFPTEEILESAESAAKPSASSQAMAERPDSLPTVAALVEVMDEFED
jgi:hypothetical protein